MKELFILSSDTYNEDIIPILKHIKHDPVCYVTMNKTHMAIKEMLREHGVDISFHFLDTITPSVLGKRGDACVFLDSQTDLNVFTESILNAVKLHRSKTVIFDSLSSFLIYKDEKEVIGFFNYLISFLEKLDCGLKLFVLDEDKDRESVKQLKMSVDEIHG